MLGVSEGLLGSSGDGTAATATAHESDGGGGGSGAGEVGGGGVGSNSGMFGEEEKGRIIEEGDRNSAGNRWPRQETMALLKIRSDMDAAFRDSSPKGPLWEEVSRKLAELGYHRSAKKCKEKFENVYKYHKRTKDDRATKSDGKTYRFFDQLQALEHHNQLSLLPPPSRPQTLQPPHPAMPETNPPTLSQVTVPSTTSPTIVTTIATTTTLSHNTFPPPPTTTSPTPITTIFPPSFPNVSAAAANPVSNSMSSSSTSTSSDEELFREGRRKRKRKWEDYFERLMKEMIEKQEALQKRFLDRIEIRERDRMAREEAWRMQEMARMNREREILAQERSTAAAKDAAMIAFLQKISGQQNTPVQLSNNNNNPSPAPAPALPPPLPHPQPHQQVPTPTTTTLPLPLPPPPPRLKTQPVNIPTLDNGENLKLNSNLNLLPTTSSSRWPKAEVEALIQLRTNLDIKYQDNGPKGPLWEEISDGLRKLGYNRNAKRCKEKWENINKYFKKVKESNKQRPEDSKTCPYYHLLDALYKEKNKNNDNNSTVSSSLNPSYGNLKSENNPMVPLMVQPERQWPLQPPDENNVNQNQEEEGGDEDDDEEDEGGGNYEIVANKPSSMETVE